MQQKNWSEETSGVDASSFAGKVDLPSLKSGLEKLDINKLRTVPTNLLI